MILGQISVSFTKIKLTCYQSYHLLPINVASQDKDKEEKEAGLVLFRVVSL
jgi:hypothetical protein